MSHWKIIQPQTSDKTNLGINPSFETNTTTWAAGTNWTLARSKTYAVRGLYSGRLTAAASAGTVMLSHTPSSNLSTTTTYIASAWIYVSSGWNGGNIRIGSSSYAGIVETYNHIWTAGTDSEGQWYYIETQLVTAADVAGTIDIEATSAAGVGNILYVDGFMLVATSSPITTFDGDTPGCYWNGAEHASTSVAPAGIRNVGVETDLDDLNLTVLEGSSGLGMPSVEHVTSKTMVGIGEIYHRSNVLPRVLTIAGYHPGTSRATLHSYRKDILDIIYPNAEREKFYLRYYGANSNKPVELECVYDDGYGYFETNEIGFNEEINFRCIAYDPFWYELPNQKADLTTRASASGGYILAKVSGDWSDLSQPFNGAPLALAYDEKRDILYVAGIFTIDAYRIMQYSSGAWTDLGAGLDNTVRALAIAPNGDLYAGGDFTDLQGGGLANANYIAMWDVSAAAWVALGTGMNGAVYDLDIDGTGKLYVAGAFTTGNAVTLNKIGYWNGTTFVAMDSGTTGSSTGSIVHDSANNIYVGGNFTTIGAGATTVNYIARWDGAAWSALGTGLSASPSCLHMDQAGNLYAGGDFVTAGGVTVNNIAMWTGGGWYSLDSGVSGTVHTVYTIQSSNGLLWVGGAFTAAGSGGLDLASRMAIWNGSSWVHTDVDFPDDEYILDIIITHNKNYENIYIAWSDFGTTAYSVDTTVTNSGSALAYPVLEVWNEGGSANDTVVYLKNETTGATIWFDYDLQVEEKLTIDFNPNHFSVTSNYFGNVPHAILGGSDVNFYLQPGANVITAFTLTAAITAGLSWRPAHWSVDGVAA